MTSVVVLLNQWWRYDWMSNYITYTEVEGITYPCPDIIAGLAYC